MVFYHKYLASILLLSLLALSACDMPSTDNTNIKSALSGANEVPPANGKGSGEADVDIDAKNYKLSWTIKYSDLSGPVTGAHFHGPAIAGANADVLVPINGDLSSPIKGEATLSAEQTKELLEGKWYVNLHTATYPDGEVRGQLVVKE